MALKARYTVVDGEVIAEKRSGVRHQLVPDPLGSTIALLDNTQTQTDTFTYWPYGEEQSRTGTTATPLRFVGTLGYYRDSSTKSYVRARFYSSVVARFLTQVGLEEQLGGEHPYGYAMNNPTNYVDPSGLGPPPHPPVFIPSSTCGGCFAQIKMVYFFTYNHFCHHYYAHCTMCCILSRSYGETCANISQHDQIVHGGTGYSGKSDPNHDANWGRWHGCNAGKAIARDPSKNSMPCAAACLEKGSGFPWPTDGDPNYYPFKLSITQNCAQYLKDPTPFADPNPGCYMGQQQRRPCPNI